MGLFSFVGDILGIGGSSSTTVSTTQTATQDIDISVNPQIKVGVDVDTAPIGREVGKAFTKATDKFATTIEKGVITYGNTVQKGLVASASAQQGLAIVAERQQETEAEQTLFFQESFRWLQGFAGRTGKYTAIVITGILLVWVYKK